MKKWLTTLLVFLIILILHPAVYATDGQTPSGVRFENIEAFVDNYVSVYIGQTTPGLAVVVIKDGEILLSRGYGFADVDKGLSVDPGRTVFEYGSVSKLFVYTAIMQLVEAGRLELDADMRTWLPAGFLRKMRYDDPVTMLHVMSHTTGFEDYLFDLVVTSNIHQGFEQTLRNSQPGQVYRPGTVSAYSNYAVALAASIVQDLAGQEFYTYAMDKILLPSGMDRTAVLSNLGDKPWLADDKATGYVPAGAGSFKKGDWSYIPLYPVGGINGTAEDLARFAMALMPADGSPGPLFQNRETLDKMLSQSHAMGPGLTGFAHGFIEYDGRYRGYGHGGNTACFTAQMNIVPEEQFGVIVLANAASEMDLTEGLTKALLGENQSQTPPGENLPDAAVVAGTYISARRPHSSFLKLYGFLSLLNVRTLSADTIEIGFVGQSARYEQIEPFVFRQTDADGAVFQYNFKSVYFEMDGGAVRRLSGDFLPLPAGHTVPWLLADALATLVCVLFLLFAPFIILSCSLRRRKKIAGLLATDRRMHALYAIFVLSGTLLLINNVILIWRMLSNNYRSIAEVLPQILINDAVALITIAAGVMTAVFGKTSASKKQRVLFVISAALLAVFITILIKWQFIDVSILT
jgi:CubicO group peptidase (beta-lactamase class C family)